MIQIAIILLIALTFSIVVTPLVRQLALRVGAISVPRSRDVHITPVPLLGGAAIYVAFVIALFFIENQDYIREGISILLGATLVALVGMTDDRWGLPATVKMIAQVLAAVLLLLGGVKIQLFSEPWFNWALTIAWIVGITNALNFLDNMDGLSAGIATVVSAFFLLLATMNEPRQVLVGTMAAALMGACVGFLRYNFQSSIFMGDTGSMFLGFLLASLAIKLRFLSNIPVVTWMVPVCVLGLPIFDTTLVVISRLRRGVNPFTTAGKDHISHRLVALGMSRLEAVLTCYLLTGACGMTGVYMTQARMEEAYVVAGFMGLMLVAGVVWMERNCPAGVARKKVVEKAR
jgi:UDP-GlcNAc:undecaprenyl-phosphate GlcNAc-1-phosphate transferase